MDERHELELIGITYNQIEAGVYAVILQQKGGTRRIPIIIGATEAQAIECRLQNIVTPRPLTHDLMVNTMRAFGLQLSEVNLKKLPNGVFAADLVVTDGERTLCIDARSSDSLALAVRFGVPIYTTSAVLREAGFDTRDTTPPHGDPEARPAHADVSEPSDPSATFASWTDLQLHEAMARAVEQENYELAARIKSELDSRSNP